MAHVRFARIVCTTVLFVLLALVFVFNILNLNEAYGSGPPYYSRTTNMDKWSDPLPLLALVDVITISTVTACFYVLKQIYGRAPPNTKRR